MDTGRWPGADVLAGGRFRGAARRGSARLDPARAADHRAAADAGVWRVRYRAARIGAAWLTCGADHDRRAGLFRRAGAGAAVPAPVRSARLAADLVVGADVAGHADPDRRLCGRYQRARYDL